MLPLGFVIGAKVRRRRDYSGLSFIGDDIGVITDFNFDLKRPIVYIKFEKYLNIPVFVDSM